MSECVESYLRLYRGNYLQSYPRPRSQLRATFKRYLSQSARYSTIHDYQEQRYIWRYISDIYSLIINHSCSSSNIIHTVLMIFISACLLKNNAWNLIYLMVDYLSTVISDYSELQPVNYHMQHFSLT